MSKKVPLTASSQNSLLGEKKLKGMRNFDAIVVGGGLVGVSIAYGLLKQRLSVLILDEGDIAFRASRGNFGLIWVQSKGVKMPSYAAWTRRSSDLWADFAEQLTEETGVTLHYSRKGGYHFCLSEQEFNERSTLMARLAFVTSGAFEYEMLSHNELRYRFPELGPSVFGASYCPHDGHVGSLQLLMSMHRAFHDAEGSYLANASVSDLKKSGNSFEVRTRDGEVFSAARVVLAAGNGTKELAPMVGLSAPVRPQKGQVMVTAKQKPFLDVPTALLRQTGEGSLLIGDSKEETGFDDMTTPEVMRDLAARAVATFPHLAQVRAVRTWGALRVMTPDGHPIYAQSREAPGAYVACMHSGVTLAAAHAGPLAEAIAAGTLPENLSSFSPDRFDVH